MKKALLNDLSLSPKTKVAIYGAGLLGVKLYKHLKENYPLVEIKFFIDKNQKQKNIKIYTIKQAREYFNEIDVVLIASIPPNSLEMEKELVEKKYLLAYREEDTLIERPCHRENLFIRENGDIYPCCLRWGVDKYKIGTIFDDDLLEKIDNFNQNCICDNFKLIKGEKLNRYQSLNIELSYICQAKCVMCCVNSPDLDKNNYKFDNYDKLENLISKLNPETVYVQGGEILVQPKSLDFIEKIEEKYGTKFALVTNGNNLSQIKRAIKLFDSIAVSMVGFQEETYKTIMGLDIKNTIEFCEQILAAGKKLNVKYLLSPINIHEAPLFLQWALSLKGLSCISIHDSSTAQYINRDTADNYWGKIQNRVQRKIREIIKDKNLPPMDIDFVSRTILGISE